MKTETAIFAAGCFWGVQAYFDKLPGILATRVGYSGGHTKNPTYRQVCHGDTGHAEAIEIQFDPEKISYQQLVEKFFDCHNPTTLNRQGPDIGEQYRSAIFYLNDEQKTVAETARDKLQAKQSDHKKIVTEITQASEFFPAEEYHQKYFEKQGGGACHY